MLVEIIFINYDTFWHRLNRINSHSSEMGAAILLAEYNPIPPYHTFERRPTMRVELIRTDSWDPVALLSE